MKKFYGILAITVALLAVGVAEPFQEAQVTCTVKSVSLVENERNVKPAAEGDIVKGRTGLKTGVDSRAELRFPDTTVLRVGANSLFSFQSGSREMDLESGTMLFSAPKGEGGGQVQAGAVTAAVTGTEFLLARYPTGEVRLVVLEGKVVLFFTANPKTRRVFRAGQSVTVAPGAVEIPRGVTIDLHRLIATSRLVEAGGFEPLPRLALLKRVADSQQGKIRRLPDAVGRDAQTAQITRRQTGANQPPAPSSGRPMNQPQPQVTPPPAPIPPPPPRPTPPPPTPVPTGTPT
jgi:hypothetical protein